MPRTGRPPTPVEVKRKRGTDRPDRTPPSSEMVPLRGANVAPAPPDDLEERGRLYWVTIWASGAKEWLSPDADTPTLYAACKLIDEIHAMRTLIAEKGLTHLEPIVLPNGNLAGAKMVPSPMIKELRTAETHLERHLSTLGFTPTARARLGIAEVRRQNEVEELMTKRAERRRQLAPGDGDA